MMVTRIRFSDGEEAVTEWSDDAASPAGLLSRMTATAEWEYGELHAGAWLEFR